MYVKATILDDGHEAYDLVGDTAEDVIMQMKLQDWSIPSTYQEFTDNVVRRIQMTGYTMVFWDGTSFLMCLQELGFIDLWIGGERIVKEK